MERNPPFIVCAANRYKKTDIIFLGARHFDSHMRNSIKIYFSMLKKEPDWANYEQGFIDQYGQFYTRKEAWEIAQANNQIKNLNGGAPGSLHSEHLY